MIPINERISLDEDELQFEFVRSSGPGGQNVNKVSTAVRLRFDATASPSIPPEVRERLLRLAGRKVGSDGFLTIQAQTERTQEGNRREAIGRLTEMILKACERPKPRRPTRPSLGSRTRRLDTKRKHGETKARRKSLGATDDE